MVEARLEARRDVLAQVQGELSASPAASLATGHDGPFHRIEQEVAEAKNAGSGQLQVQSVVLPDVHVPGRGPPGIGPPQAPRSASHLR